MAINSIIILSDNWLTSNGDKWASKHGKKHFIDKKFIIGALVTLKFDFSSCCYLACTTGESWF